MSNNSPIHVTDWTEEKLIDLCEFIIRGKAPQYVSQSSMRVIGQRCVRETFQGNEARFQDTKRIEGHLIAKKGDILLNSTGTGTIGRSCVFEANTDFIVDGHVTVIRPFLQRSNPSILNSLLKSPQLQRYFEVYCYTGSTNQIELSAAAVAGMKICLPSISEQQAISAILDKLSEDIGQTEAVIAKLRQVKAGMLHDLLTGGLDENGELRNSILNPEKFKDSPLGRIPKNWEIQSILDIAPIVEGQVDPKISPFTDFPLVAPDHIESGTGRLLNLKTAAEQRAISGKYRFQSGDVVYSKIRPYLRKVWLASFEGLCSADMYPFRPGTEVNSQFLLMTLLSERFSTFATSVSERSGFPKINRKELSLFDVILPPKREQDRIAQSFQSVEDKLLTEQIYKDKLLHLKQGLMHDLLTGTVRVSPQLLEANHDLRP